MKNTKKGFTLVELLVVIAIVAILATVAIIGYTSFTKKAKSIVRFKGLCIYSSFMSISSPAIVS